MINTFSHLKLKSLPSYFFQDVIDFWLTLTKEKNIQRLTWLHPRPFWQQPFWLVIKAQVTFTIRPFDTSVPVSQHTGWVLMASVHHTSRLADFVGAFPEKSARRLKWDLLTRWHREKKKKNFWNKCIKHKKHDETLYLHHVDTTSNHIKL